MDNWIEVHFEDNGLVKTGRRDSSWIITELNDRFLPRTRPELIPTVQPGFLPRFYALAELECIYCRYRTVIKKVIDICNST